MFYHEHNHKHASSSQCPCTRQTDRQTDNTYGMVQSIDKHTPHVRHHITSHHTIPQQKSCASHYSTPTHPPTHPHTLNARPSPARPPDPTPLQPQPGTHRYAVWSLALVDPGLIFKELAKILRVLILVHLLLRRSRRRGVRCGHSVRYRYDVCGER